MSKVVLSKFFSRILVSLMVAPAAFGQTYIMAEGDLTWQSRNEQRVPGDTGTGFSIADFDKGPIPTYRIYVGHIWKETHEVRALYAPLEFAVNGSFSRPTEFAGGSFAPNTSTEAFYKFNSYRLTYAYHFEKAGDWKWALGFTGKVRDAEVRLSQNGLVKSKSNVGFVPLLHFQARRYFSESYLFRVDFDGLAAPQGRAFDVGLFFEKILENPNYILFAGYRGIEGGADNDEVYNFAWFHKAVVGLRASF